jgi:hypothetical protein
MTEIDTKLEAAKVARQKAWEDTNPSRQTSDTAGQAWDEKATPATQGHAEHLETSGRGLPDDQTAADVQAAKDAGLETPDQKATRQAVRRFDGPDTGFGKQFDGSTDPWADNGQRRRHDDAQVPADFAQLLTDAETEADEAHAAAKKATTSLTAKVMRLHATEDAGGVSGADHARIGVVQMKVLALDPTRPEILAK